MSDGIRAITVIIISVIVALLLSILPLPTWLIWLQPQWVALVVIFWAMNLPYRFGVGYAWIIGLMLDVVYGSLLGAHGLVFVIITYVVVKIHARLQLFSNGQRTIAVFFLILAYQLLWYLIQGLLGHLPLTWRYWVPPITSAIVWPWIYYILRSYQFRYRIKDESMQRFGYYGRE